MTYGTNGNKINNQSVGEVIISALEEFKKNNTNPTTYQIAKACKISWSTANTHCYKLKDLGKLDGEMQYAEIGSGKKMVWWLK